MEQDVPLKRILFLLCGQSRGNSLKLFDVGTHNLHHPFSLLISRCYSRLFSLCRGQRCVHPTIVWCFLRADTSVCPYGK